MGNYCEATGLIYTDTINISFRATNPAGTNAGGEVRYYYDDVGPYMPNLLSPISGGVFTETVLLIWETINDSSNNTPV
jgi:hypothetical protein